MHVCDTHIVHAIIRTSVQSGPSSCRSSPLFFLVVSPSASLQLLRVMNTGFKNPWAFSFLGRAGDIRAGCVLAVCSGDKLELSMHVVLPIPAHADAKEQIACPDGGVSSLILLPPYHHKLTTAAIFAHLQGCRMPLVLTGSEDRAVKVILPRLHCSTCLGCSVLIIVVQPNHP